MEIVERIDAFVDAGVTLPIVYAVVAPEPMGETIAALGPRREMSRARVELQPAAEFGGAKWSRWPHVFAGSRSPQIVFLHDRRTPGSRANVPHIAIALRGVDASRQARTPARAHTVCGAARN
jgi:hypothetical protein